MRASLMIAAALAAAGPNLALSAQEQLQLVRPGDAEMSCQALAGEINALAAPATPPAAEAAAQPKKKRGLGFLGRALASAAPMLGGGLGGNTGAVVAQVAGAAQAATMEAQIDRQMTAAEQATERAMEALTPSVATQRKERLLAIFTEKHC